MKNKRLYNFLVNTYGLSKEKVMENMSERFKDLEEALFQQITREVKEKLDSYSIERFMKNKISQILTQGFNQDEWRVKNTTLESYIKDKVDYLVKQEVESQLRQKYELNLNFKKKEKSNE